MSGLQSVAEQLPLLAQRSNWARMGDRFSGHHLRVQTEDIVGAAMLLLAAVLLFFGLQYAMTISKRLNGEEEPRDVLRKLMAAHNLSRADRRLVREIATQAQLAKPAEVFVRPELFKSERAQSNAAIRRLGRRLFGD